MSLDKYLIEHCAPTLASLKTANMFSCAYESENALDRTISAWNILFDDKGVELLVLRKMNNTALIYVCRKKMLCEDLNKSGVGAFLKTYGYLSTDADYALSKLKSRLANRQDFPHEIGVFLNYPLEDVKGFIEQGAQNCLCSGCWKVYCNECEAIKMFNKYKKCREVYAKLYADGSRNILQLTVKR